MCCVFLYWCRSSWVRVGRLGSRLGTGEMNLAVRRAGQDVGTTKGGEGESIYGTGVRGYRVEEGGRKGRRHCIPL
jgi:hypothetical protein